MAETESGERKAFKLWFDQTLARELAARLAAVEAQFHVERFVALASANLDGLEMMARVGQFADALRQALPQHLPAALQALVSSLPPVLPSAEGVTDAGYRFWPYGEFIARYGLPEFEASFHAMTELTMRFTSEFAVRPFLAAEPDRTLDKLEGLANHTNFHVRRWVSEGTRSRLPWGKRVPALEARAERRLALIERLHRDPERYVLRSVANHLQDLLKDNRDLALPALSRWAAEGHPGAAWVAKHAARGLLKAADPHALRIFGVDAVHIACTGHSVQPGRVRIGEAVAIAVHLANTGHAPADARVDYELRSPGAGARENRKVFRLGDAHLEPGQTATLTARHTFVHRTIRTVRPGVHHIELRVNGRAAANTAVQVLPE